MQSQRSNSRSNSMIERDEVSALLDDLKTVGEASIAKLTAEAKDNPSMASHPQFHSLLQHMRKTVAKAFTLLPDFNLAHKPSGLCVCVFVCLWPSPL
jgi:hypothetical protein